MNPAIERPFQSFMPPIGFFCEHTQEDLGWKEGDKVRSFFDRMLGDGPGCAPRAIKIYGYLEGRERFNQIYATCEKCFKRAIRNRLVYPALPPAERPILEFTFHPLKGIIKKPVQIRMERLEKIVKAEMKGEILACKAVQYITDVIRSTALIGIMNVLARLFIAEVVEKKDAKMDLDLLITFFGVVGILAGRMLSMSSLGEIRQAMDEAIGVADRPAFEEMDPQDGEVFAFKPKSYHLIGATLGLSIPKASNILFQVLSEALQKIPPEMKKSFDVSEFTQALSLALSAIGVGIVIGKEIIPNPEKMGELIKTFLLFKEEVESNNWLDSNPIFDDQVEEECVS